MTLQLGVTTRRGKTVGEALAKNSDEASKLRPGPAGRRASTPADVQTSNFSISPVDRDNRQSRRVRGDATT